MRCASKKVDTISGGDFHLRGGGIISDYPPGWEVPLGGFVMASGAGKAAQPPGPGSAVNGTAAEFSNIEQELYDYQMHSKMCKKIAQLTKVRPAGDTGGGREARRPDVTPVRLTDDPLAASHSDTDGASK